MTLPSPEAAEGPGTPTARYRLVRASAGTGKTYALTTRYLALLRAGVDPAAILATTFTRKAAGEIFERVLTRLSHAVLSERARQDLDQALRDEGLLQNPPPLTAEACADMLDRLTERLDRAAITTLDGFFARLCSAFSLELELPVDPALTDDGSSLAAELREAGIEAMLGRAAEDDFAALLTLLRQVHHDSAKRSVTASLDRVFRGDAEGFYATYRQARNEHQWAQLGHEPLPPRADLMKLKQDLIDHLPELGGAIPVTKTGPNAGLPKKNWLAAYETLKHAAFHEDWARLTEETFATNLAQGKPKYDQVDYPEVWARFVRPLALLAPAFAIDQLNRQHRATHQLLDRFALHFEERCKQQRVLLFADLTDALARHLREPATHHADDNPEAVRLARWRNELTYRLDGKVEHLLIDEFQDTAIDQFAVLWPLIDEATADASSDRSVFVVGDTKQSLYGWRGGRVELFDALQARLEPRGLQSRTQDVNYRSSPAVLDAVNRVFGGLDETEAWPENRAAISRFVAGFSAHRAANELGGEVLVQTTAAVKDISDPTGTQDDEDADAFHDDPHADAAARHVAELAQRWPWAAIGVLVRTNAQAGRVLHALRQAGVQASGETGAALTDHPAVGAVLAAMRLADHADDQVAAFHVERSPLREVLGLRDRNASSARRASARLRRALTQRGFAAVLADWVVALAPACDAAALRRLQQLAQLAERYQPISPLRADAFVRFVEAARVEDPSADRVRVMTIHRAKGLEFEAVVLPYLHGPLGFKATLLEDRDNETGPIDRVFRSGTKPLRAQFPELETVYDRSRERWAYEQLCTLYVALTRARIATHVLVPPIPKGRPRKSATLLAPMLHTLVPEHADLGQADAVLYRYEHGGGADAVLRIDETSGTPNPPARKVQDAATRTWPMARAPKLQRKPGEASDTTSAEQTIAQLIRPRDEVDAFDPAAADFGTRAHAWLQQIEFFEPGESLPPWPEDAGLAKHLRRAMASDELRAAMSPEGTPHLRTELALLSAGPDGEPNRLIIDRLIWWTDEHGQATHAEIQDFKTDRPPSQVAELDGSSSMDDWLKQRAEHHRPQLEAYRQAAAAWLGLEPSQVCATLLFTGPGRAVRLD